jgi:Flp pilus assembly protein TadG
MVEMALLLPFMLLLIFGIIDLGWYVYGFGTVYQAARNGSEAAAQLPPYEDTLEDPALMAEDPCYLTILSEVTKQTVLFDLSNSVTVRYPDDSLGMKRDVGNPIEVRVTATLRPLTPLPQFTTLANNGVYTLTASSIRSIEALGNTPPSEDYPNGIICLQP